jgi:hypothetical protein
MNVSQQQIISSKKLYTQTVIEARNIQLEISFQIKYRFEMFIKLLELSLENLHVSDNQF